MLQGRGEGVGGGEVGLGNPFHVPLLPPAQLKTALPCSVEGCIPNCTSDHGASGFFFFPCEMGPLFSLLWAMAPCVTTKREVEWRAAPPFFP